MLWLNHDNDTSEYRSTSGECVEYCEGLTEIQHVRKILLGSTRSTVRAWNTERYRQIYVTYSICLECCRVMTASQCIRAVSLDITRYMRRGKLFLNSARPTAHAQSTVGYRGTTIHAWHTAEYCQIHGVHVDYRRVSQNLHLTLKP